MSQINKEKDMEWNICNVFA